MYKKRQISPWKQKKRGFRGVAPDPERARKHPCKGLGMAFDGIVSSVIVLVMFSYFLFMYLF
ncbi:hypothetical protein BREVNS_0279 [Brevinematales bacterium NS]|nr:hypothetical protein BREVNS_0279 [Brevinematales bacterium NS]